MNLLLNIANLSTSNGPNPPAADGLISNSSETGFLGEALKDLYQTSDSTTFSQLMSDATNQSFTNQTPTIENEADEEALIDMQNQIQSYLMAEGRPSLAASKLQAKDSKVPVASPSLRVEDTQQVLEPEAALPSQNITKDIVSSAPPESPEKSQLETKKPIENSPPLESATPATAPIAHRVLEFLSGEFSEQRQIPAELNNNPFLSEALAAEDPKLFLASEKKLRDWAESLGLDIPLNPKEADRLISAGKFLDNLGVSSRKVLEELEKLRGSSLTDQADLPSDPRSVAKVSHNKSKIDPNTEQDFNRQLPTPIVTSQNTGLKNPELSTVNGSQTTNPKQVIDQAPAVPLASTESKLLSKDQKSFETNADVDVKSFVIKKTTQPSLTDELIRTQFLKESIPGETRSGLELTTDDLKDSTDVTIEPNSLFIPEQAVMEISNNASIDQMTAPESVKSLQELVSKIEGMQAESAARTESTFILQSEDLGQVEVEAKMQGQELSLIFKSSTDRALESLAANQAQLIESLEAARIQVQKIDFQNHAEIQKVNPDLWDNTRQQSHNHQNFSQNRRQDHFYPELAGAETTTPSTRYNFSRSGVYNPRALTSVDAANASLMVRV